MVWNKENGSAKENDRTSNLGQWRSLYTLTFFLWWIIHKIHKFWARIKCELKVFLPLSDNIFNRRALGPMQLLNWDRCSCTCPTCKSLMAMYTRHKSFLRPAYRAARSLTFMHRSRLRLIYYLYSMTLFHKTLRTSLQLLYVSYR